MENLNHSYPLYSLPLINDLEELISAKVEQIPGEAAIMYQQGKEVVSKTYKELYEDVCALRAFLLAGGISGKHIAIVSENSYAWVAAFLALTNSGNVAVPIDKALSAEDVNELAEFADCEYAFVSAKFKEKLSDKFKLFDLEKLDEYIAEGKAAGDVSVPAIDRDALAAIFYTSGTTGRSKGVMLSHKNMAADINSACKNFKLTGTTLSILPYHHTFGLITAVFMVLNYGKVVFINQNMRYIQKELQIIKPELIFMVPLFVESFYKMILQAEKAGANAKMLFGGNIEYIISGGAHLSQKYIDRYKSRGITILNGYGITECAPVVAVNRNLFQKDHSIGQILDCCDITIAEDGEICIAGDNVMLGYYKDEEASKALKDGVFSTGDLGCVDEDNFLFITGRKKNLIILSNGENVSPEKLEEMILADSMAAEALVYADRGIMKAEIFPAAETADKEYFDALIDKVNSQLPVYMKLNKVIVRDSEFPKNTNGKILRSLFGGNKDV